MLRGQFPLRGYSVRMAIPEAPSSTRICIWSQKRRALSMLSAEQRMAACTATWLPACVRTLTLPSECSTRKVRPAGSAAVF